MNEINAVFCMGIEPKGHLSFIFVFLADILLFWYTSLNTILENVYQIRTMVNGYRFTPVGMTH